MPNIHTYKQLEVLISKEKTVALQAFLETHKTCCDIISAKEALSFQLNEIEDTFMVECWYCDEKLDLTGK